MDLSAVSSVLKTIGELTQEVTSLLGVKDQVKGLERELKWMQSFLKVADARKADNEVVRTSVAEIRELAYDAEDVIETFALKVASRRKGGISNIIKRSACFLNEGWLLCQTKCEIEKITARIKELTRQLKTYDVTKLGDGEGSSTSNERRESRRPYPHIIDDNIVGLEDDIKKLVSVLVDKKSDCRVASICGMGGLGKTTLAKKVYHHSTVRDHFNHLAWVFVSEQCQKRKVWEDILSDLGLMDQEEARKKREEVLAETLFNFLKDKRCLVMLDDLWSIQDWDSIKPAFPMKETSSKLLLTSRNKDVASHADRSGFLHELKCLNESNSWELFHRIAFPNKDSPDYRADGRREELGKILVKHCAGLPLAIIVLGGILATKNSLNEWQIVYENVNSYLKRGKGQGIEEVLALSYDDLPPSLRPCFFYLSHFPEDYEIQTDRLIQLWVAEGVVSSKQEEGDGGEITEDVAECCLIELVQRCMIQVREIDVATLKIKTVQMHDLMRNLCLSKAKQENFLFIMEKPIPNLRGQNVLSSKIRRVRRVAAHHFFRIQRIRSRHLRSLLVLNSFFPDESVERVVPLSILRYFDKHEHDKDFNPLLGAVVLLILCIGLSEIGGIWAYIFNNFKLLRVLDFKANGRDRAGCMLPSDIGNLIHLRFLSLRDLSFCRSKLPSSLGNLRCLQTLDLRIKGEWSDSIHVPNVIWRLEQLRHLYLPEKCRGKTKLKLGTLRNLQTLVNFDSKSCYVKDLFNMTNLRELEIRWHFNIEDFKEDQDNSPILGSKCLQSLSIFSNGSINPRHLAHLLSSCVCICKLSLEVEIGKLPEYHHFSEDLTYMYLSHSKLDEDPMPTIEKLHNLRILKFGDSAFTGKVMVCSARAFPKLDSLSLQGLSSLEELRVEEGAMPTLRSLEIVNCRNMKMLPDRFITLRELSIKRMPRAFKDKLVEGGEDLYKVQHVPSITFQDCDLVR